MGINNALGGFAFTFEDPNLQQMVGEAAEFQKLLGASDEQMTNIFQSSLATGKGIEDLQEEVLGVSNELEKQTGIRLNERQLLLEAASITGQIRAQLGGNVVEIGKAIAAAKSFGMTLQDVSGAESSVVCIHSDAAGGATSFKVYVEDPSQENTGTTAVTSSANSFLLYQRAVVADEVTRINVPGGFGSRMFCVFKPTSGTANVKIWAWSASSQARR